MIWIEVIKAVAPIIIALLRPELKDVSGMIANSMIEAEKTDKNGPDKLDMVVKDMIPVAAKNAPTKTIDEVKDAMVKGIDASVAVANIIKQMKKFDDGED